MRISGFVKGFFARTDKRDWQSSAKLQRTGGALFCLAVAFLAPTAAFAALTVTPITWDVVGLDSNRPETEGPNLFPVGVEVCSDIATSDVDVTFDWELGSDATYIFTRPFSDDSLNFAIGAGECVDAYFEIELDRSDTTFGESRAYQINAVDNDNGGVTGSTPSNRQIYVEFLVSQNRNTTSQIRWGQLANESDWQVLGAGGGLNLQVGETYFIELTTKTSTSYEQLESFLTLSNTIFQVLSVSTDYESLSFNAAPSGRVTATNHPQLYADGCGWDPNTDSPNYLSCLDTGKAGGEVITTYQINIISGGGDRVDLIALIYDKSGGSFHYNADFSDSPGELITYDPTDSGFAKRFSPSTIALAGISRLVLTISNPNPVPLSGYTFTDNLPANVLVVDPLNYSSTCGGTVTTNGPTFDQVNFDIGANEIGANSTCSIIVDVTSSAEGVYNNVSQNLFIDGEDTGVNATATLTVNNAPPPPACVAGQTFAQWQDFDSAATPNETALHASLIAADVSANFGNGGSSSVDATNFNSASNSWRGIGWRVATSPVEAGSGPNETSYFEFDLKTETFATDPTKPMTIGFYTNLLPQGDWAANNNLAVNVHISTDGGLTFSTLGDVTDGGADANLEVGTGPGSTAVGNLISKNSWTYVTGTFTPGADAVDGTIVRINYSGANNAAEAAAMIDDVSFVGCGPGTPGATPNPPTISKSFSPNPIGANQVSTLTFTITNPNAGDSLSGIDIDDTLPEGVIIAATPGVINACGGTVTADAGSSLIRLVGGGVLAATESCTIEVDVTSASVGDFVNISDFIYADESGQNSDPATGSATDTLTVLAPPQIEKTFDSGLLLTSDNPAVSWLGFVVTNPNTGDAISSVGFIDDLPSNVGDMVVADPNAPDSGLSVVKTLTARSVDPVVAGGTLTYSIVATNGTGSTLTDLVIADSLVSIDQTHSTGDCTWDSTATGTLANAESVTCTITYTVSAADETKGYVINRATASSTFPTLNAATAQHSLLGSDDGCIGAVWAPVVGATSVALSGASIAAGDTCTVGTWVTAPVDVDPYDNTSGNVSHVVGGQTENGNTANDSLVVDDPIPVITVTKDIGTASDPDGVWKDYLAVEPTDDVYYRFTVVNDGETVLDNLSLSDDILDAPTLATDCILPTELPVADAGDPLAHIFVCVSGPYTVGATPGEVTNTATATGDAPDTTQVQDTDTATHALAELTLDKTADIATFSTAGDQVNYSFTVENTGDAVLSGPITIDDDLTTDESCPALTTIGNNNTVFEPGETIVCSATYEIAAGDVTATSVTNTASASSPEVTSNDDSVTVYLVISPPSISKAFSPDPIQTSGISTLTLTITNPSETVTQVGVAVSDTFPTGMTVAATPNASNSCGGTLTAVAAAGSISLSGGSIAGDGSCSISVDVTATQTGTNTTGTVTSTNGGDGDTGSDTLTVIDPPSIAKAFSPDPIAAGGTSTLTLTITNPNVSTGLTGVAVSDTFPTGMTVAATPNASNSCGGTLTAVAAAGSISLSGGSIAGDGSCSISVDVTATQTGTNTTGTVTSTNGGDGDTGSDTLTVIDPPSIAKAFSPDPIAAGGTSTLTLTITNPNVSTGLTGVAVSDTFPTGMTVAATPNASNSCGGTLTAVAAAGSISLSGGSIAGDGSCSISVDVTATQTGTNTTGTVTSTNGGDGNTGSDTLTVIDPPSIAKAFSPDPIAAGGTSTLTLTITNPNVSTGLTGVAVSDTFPTGMTVAATPNASNSCGGTLTAVAAAGSISLSGGSIAGDGSCSISVDVTATQTGTNTTGTVTSTNGGDGDTGSDTLTVIDPPSIAKAFSPDPIAAGGTSTLTLTITNPNVSTGLTGVAVSDTFPTGMTVAATPNASNSCGGTLTAVAAAGSISLSGGSIAGDGSCSISVDVTATQTGTNTTGTVTSTNGGDGDTGSDTLTVIDPPSIAKAFSPDPIAAGGTSTLTLTITNPNVSTGLTGVAVSDTFPTGMTVAATPNASNSCGGTLTAVAAAGSISLSGGSIAGDGSCSISVDVTATQTGTNTTGTVTSTNGGDGDTGSDTLTVIDPPSIAKAFSPDPIAAGGTSTLTLTITNPNVSTGLTGVAVSDTFPTGMTVAATPNASNSCGGTLTAVAAAGSISLSGGSIAGDGSCSISVDVTATQTGTNTTGTVTSTNGGDGNTGSDTLTVPDDPVIGLAKTIGGVTDVGSGTYETMVTMTVENLGKVPLDNVQVVDDLDTTFPNPLTHSVIVAPNATGTLTANAAYNGSGDTNLLTAASSTLAVGATATITFTIQFTTNGEAGPFYNTSTATGDSPTDTTTTDISDNGTNPDQDGEGDPDEEGENDPTPIMLELGPVEVPTVSMGSLALLMLMMLTLGALLSRRKTLG